MGNLIVFRFRGEAIAIEKRAKAGQFVPSLFWVFTGPFIGHSIGNGLIASGRRDENGPMLDRYPLEEMKVFMM